jgi:hypothetical protein
MGGIISISGEIHARRNVDVCRLVLRNAKHVACCNLRNDGVVHPVRVLAGVDVYLLLKSFTLL